MDLYGMIAVTASSIMVNELLVELQADIERQEKTMRETGRPGIRCLNVRRFCITAFVYLQIYLE
jgi:hypothetical protein